MFCQLHIKRNSFALLLRSLIGKHTLLNILSAWFLTCKSTAIWPTGLSGGSCPGTVCSQGRGEMDPTELRSSAGVTVPRRGMRKHLETGLVLTWHLVGRPRMSLSTLQCTGQPAPPQNYPTQNVNSATVILIERAIEKPPERAATKNSGDRGTQDHRGSCDVPSGKGQRENGHPIPGCKASKRVIRPFQRLLPYMFSKLN